MGGESELRRREEEALDIQLHQTKNKVDWRSENVGKRWNEKGEKIKMRSR